MKNRKMELLKYDWKFVNDDIDNAEYPDFDDTSWETVRVPHDWAIAGPFDRQNDIQVTKIEWDGEKEAREHNGRTGGLPHVGIGWYRRLIDIPIEAKGRQIWLEFDGVMSRSQVFVNGQQAGGRPYGYSSFKLDITDLVEFGTKNIVAVRVNNPALSSRWYPGAGIYRNVRLTIIDPVHVAHWGTYITTPVIDNDKALVRIATELKNNGNKVQAVLKTKIVSPEGKIAAEKTQPITLDSNDVVTQDFDLENITKWNLDSPELYNAVSEICVDGVVRDVYETSFGIREISFSNEKGFLLNGKRLWLKGVCLHHDLGPLGIAVNERALERQLKIMQDMGCNAVRTSHNPPTPEMLALCDRMGILVIDEAFDEWKAAKLDNAYHQFFDEWAERDMADLVRRDRNHPCVIMWSLGNELIEQWHEDGGEVARFLHDIAHKLDPARPTTAGISYPEGAIKNGIVDAVDIPGWNYCPHRYSEFHNLNPEWICYGSETMSTVSSRGVYHFPVKEERFGHNDQGHSDIQLSSYDLAVPGWATSMESEFHALDTCPYVFGQFVWTGFDYLGEPSPYNEQWPARSSYFGIVDLCGLPKDRYYMFKTQWTDQDVLHILPHWSWPGREGQKTPIHIYTSFESVELFLNGRSLGRKQFQKKSYNLLNHYRLIWEDVLYEPGELKAVAYTGATAVAEKIVKTAGHPEQISLSVDRKTLCGDGEDMAFVTVAVQDAAGTLCPHAAHRINFEIDGPGEIAAVCNGDPTCLDSFKSTSCKVFNGLCVVYLRSLKNKTGKLILKASSPSIRSQAIEIKVK